MEMIKRFKNSIVFLLCIFLLFGCATTTTQKPNIKDKSDKLFNELEKQETTDNQQNKEMKQLEKDLEKKEKIKDEDIKTEEKRQDRNIQSEEIDFEETGEGITSKYERQIDAEKRAEEDALAKALKKVGTDVYYGFTDTLAQYGDKQHQFIARYQYTWTGNLAKYERIGQPEFTTTDSGTKCIIRIKGKIYLKGQSDPLYEIKIDSKDKNFGLDKQIYSDGDEVKLNFWVTKDSYITILNIDEDKNVYLVYPNKFVKSSFIKAGEMFEIPGNLGINLKANLQEGRNETIELLHIIASKKEPLFFPEESKEINNLFSLGELKKITERLAKLNRDEWAMMVLPYTIRSK